MIDEQKQELRIWMCEQIGWSNIKRFDLYTNDPRFGQLCGKSPDDPNLKIGYDSQKIPEITLDLLAEVDRLVFNESSKYSRTIHSCLNRMSSGGNVDGWTVTLYPGSYKFFNIDLKVALSEALYEVMEWAKKEEVK